MIKKTVKKACFASCLCRCENDNVGANEVKLMDPKNNIIIIIIIIIIVTIIIIII